MTPREHVLLAIEAVTGVWACRDDVTLSELGDSLVRAEVVFEAEERTGLDLGDEPIAGMTVGELVAMAEKQAGARRCDRCGEALSRQYGSTSTIPVLVCLGCAVRDLDSPATGGR